MSEGGTHVGSIQGDLKLDISQWSRKIDEAKAKARELDGADPRVEVHADTARAESSLRSVREKIDTVAAAEARLTAAQRAHERSANQATLAEMRLDEVQKRRRTTTAQVFSAEESVRYAIERSASAEAKLTAAESALAAARAKGTAAAETEAVATEKVTSKQKAGAKQAADWRGAAIGALVAVSAAAPPVAATAVGITGALGAMGLAGVLAITGIARGMKDGTATGHAYRGIVTGLTDDVHRLQDSAAAGLLPGAEKSVSVLDAKMPGLTAMAEKYAGLLGGIAPTGLDATVTLLDRADPLLEHGAQYLAHLVSSLDGFAHGQGYQDFLDYTVRNGPEVEKFLGDAGHLVIDFLTAWSSVGATTLPILDSIVTGVDDLVKRTGPLVPAAIAVAGAYKLLSPVVGLLAGLVGQTRLLGDESLITAGKIETEAAAAKSAGGAGGLAGLKGVAGAAGLAAGLAVGNQYESGPEIDRVVNSQRSLKLRETLTASSAQHTFLRSGLASNKAPAQDAELASMMRSGDAAKAAASWQVLTAAAKQNGVSVGQLAGMYPKYTAAVRGARGATTAQTAALRDQSAAYRMVAAAQALAAKTAQGIEQTGDAARDSIDALSKSVKLNGHSLDQSTTKGRANREAMLAGVQAAQAYGAEVQKKTGSEARGRVATERMAVSMVDAAVKMGVSRKEAEKLTRQLLGIPKGISVKMQLAKDEFQARLESVRAQMAKINGLTSDVYINAIATGVSPSRAAQINRNAQFGATGGTTGSGTFGSRDAIRGLAYGGTPGFTVSGPGHASSDAAGLFALANREEVTSNLFGQADRFRPVLKAINSGRVRTPGELGEALGGRGGTTVTKTVNVGGVHLHNPVAVDPVQAAEDASQHIAAYANFPL